MAFLLFYITHPSEISAKQVASQMVERRLAACANIFPIASAYWWDVAVQQENEWVSVLKTRLELEHALEAAIREIHPYEVPCILRFEVRANESYEKWIADSTAHVPLSH